MHGEQLGRYFSGFYDGYCFLPLHAFCGQQPLISYLRPAYRVATHNAGAILALLVRRLRQAWPEVKLVFRGDSGFCRPLILAWCERHGVEYIVGLTTNSRLETLSLDIRYELAIRWGAERTKQRHFGRIDYSCRQLDASSTQGGGQGRGRAPRLLRGDQPARQPAVAL
ncbi:transposase [Pistricoccus aurantiacus]|uniref:transposase n=1 Tax=Pistricoccus aurantiacus TaxID=1883414 RepID=UPI003632C3C9